MTSESRARPLRFDLSPPIRPELGVWPGDTPASREVLAALDDGDNLTLSTLRATVHLGSHADAPAHTRRGGATIDEVPPDAFVGPCQVIRLDVARGARIEPEDLPVAITRPRVLLATGTFPDPQRFNTDFAAPSVELIEHLAEEEVRLVGTDAPSMDLFDSQDLPSHAAIVAHEMAILEGLVLDGVPAGEYELLALPLPLVGFDASPVRAVLRDL